MLPQLPDPIRAFLLDLEEPWMLLKSLNRGLGTLDLGKNAPWRSVV
jgi:hypothetical protein